MFFQKTYLIEQSSEFYNFVRNRNFKPRKYDIWLLFVPARAWRRRPRSTATWGWSGNSRRPCRRRQRSTRRTASRRRRTGRRSRRRCRASSLTWPTAFCSWDEIQLFSPASSFCVFYGTYFLKRKNKMITAEKRNKRLSKDLNSTPCLDAVLLHCHWPSDLQKRRNISRSTGKDI